MIPPCIMLDSLEHGLYSKIIQDFWRSLFKRNVGTGTVTVPAKKTPTFLGINNYYKLKESSSLVVFVALCFRPRWSSQRLRWRQ